MLFARGYRPHEKEITVLAQLDRVFARRTDEAMRDDQDRTLTDRFWDGQNGTL